MSSFQKETKNPKTGEWEKATWIDDYFSLHHYGVFFPSDPEYPVDPEKVKLETHTIVPAQNCADCQFEEGHAQTCPKYAPREYEPEKDCVCDGMKLCSYHSDCGYKRGWKWKNPEGKSDALKEAEERGRREATETLLERINKHYEVSIGSKDKDFISIPTKIIKAYLASLTPNKKV